MSAMNKLVLIFLFLSSISYAENIGYVSAESPDFGSTHVNEDMLMFFDEVVELSYEICNDAGTTIAVKLRLNQGAVNFRDTKHTFKKKDYKLRPSMYNEPAIEDFYRTQNMEGRDFLKKITNKNNLDALFYAKFKQSSIRKLLRDMRRNPNKEGNIIFIVQLYLPQSGATAIERVKIKVSELATSPTYDLDEMQADITKEYLKMFERALKTVQIGGGIQRDIPAPQESYTSDTATTTSNKEVVKQAANEKPLYDENW